MLGAWCLVQKVLARIDGYDRAGRRLGAQEIRNRRGDVIRRRTTVEQHFTRLLVNVRRREHRTRRDGVHAQRRGEGRGSGAGEVEERALGGKIVSFSVV